MKRYAIILLAILFSATTYVKAENIVIGDKLPEMRLQAWLMDMQPDQASYTCILFYHTESELCKRSLKQIKRLVKANAPHFNMIIITKEDYTSAGVALTEHLSAWHLMTEVELSVILALNSYLSASLATVNAVPYGVAMELRLIKQQSTRY